MTKDEQIDYLKEVLRAIARNIESAQRVFGYAIHPTISEAYGRATRTICVDFGETYDIPDDVKGLPHGPDWDKPMPSSRSVLN